MSQRPGFKRIVEEADKDIFDLVVFWKCDRYCRDVVFAKVTQEFLRSKGIKLIPTDDSVDPLASSIMQILSEEEIRKSKERVRSSRLERFERGMMVGRSPYGYKPVIRDKRIVGFQLDKKKSDIVKKIFSMTLNGEDYRKICKEVDLSPQQYYNIISNKVYCGYIKFEDREKKGNHPSIVSEEDFFKVQNLKKV